MHVRNPAQLGVESKSLTESLLNAAETSAEPSLSADGKDIVCERCDVQAERER